MVFSFGKFIFEESFGLIGGNKKAQIVAKNIAKKINVFRIIIGYNNNNN